MANRCSATHSLGCFGPPMHNQDQIDDIAWTGDSRLFSGASSLYSVRGELHSQVMFRLKSLKTSAVCWPESRPDSGGACSLDVRFPTRLAGGNIL